MPKFDWSQYENKNSEFDWSQYESPNNLNSMDASNNTKGTPEEAMELARQQIGEKFPNLPDWLRDAILSITPKEKSPILESAAQGVSNVTDYIPAVAGGALQGASIPIRGIAGLIPTDFTQKLSNSPDLRELFTRPSGPGQKTAQMVAELVGGGGTLGKLFQGAKYLSKAAKIPKALQNASALTASGAVGTPGDATERTLGAGGALALGGAGKVAGKVVDSLPNLIKGLFSEFTPELLVQAVQKPHDILENAANELYGQVRGAIKKRNIKVPIKDEFLDQAKEYFPQRTTATKELFNRAKNGDYDAIHDIQSGLYKKGTKQLAGDTLVEENEGEEILDLRTRINDYFKNHLIKEGHLDIAHVLGQGKKLYSKLQKTYFPKHLRKAIGKMVHSEIRLIPKNPETIFQENSLPMKDFLDKHPEVYKHLKSLESKQKSVKSLKKLGYAAAGGGGSIAGGKTLYDWLN